MLFVQVLVIENHASEDSRKTKAKLRRGTSLICDPIPMERVYHIPPRLSVFAASQKINGLRGWQG